MTAACSGGRLELVADGARELGRGELGVREVGCSRVGRHEHTCPTT